MTGDQLYRDDIAGMSTGEIREAYRAGRFEAVLRGESKPEPEPEPEPVRLLTRDDVWPR